MNRKVHLTKGYKAKAQYDLDAVENMGGSARIGKNNTELNIAREKK